MLVGARKRRPLSGAKSMRGRGEGESQVSQGEQGWVAPMSGALIARKYYYPAIAE